MKKVLKNILDIWTMVFSSFWADFLFAFFVLFAIGMGFLPGELMLFCTHFLCFSFGIDFVNFLRKLKEKRGEKRG